MHFLARIDFERCGKHVSSTILLTSDAEHRLNQQCAILLASNAWPRTKSLAPVRIDICELIFTNMATEGMRSMLITSVRLARDQKYNLAVDFTVHMFTVQSESQIYPRASKTTTAVHQGRGGYPSCSCQ